MIHLNSIKDTMPGEVYSLLNKLYTLTGAKELFETFGVVVKDKKVELEVVTNFLKNSQDFLARSEELKEFRQVEQYIDMQIKSNEAMLQSAEGFMKQMIVMNIETAKNQLGMALTQFMPVTIKAVTGFANTIIEDVDRKTVMAVIGAGTTTLLTLRDVLTTITLEVVESIKERYSNVEEVETPIKKEVSKKEVKVEKEIEVEITKAKIIPTKEGVKVVDKKVEKEVVKVETSNFDDEFSGLDNLDDFGMEAPAKKETVKKEETKVKASVDFDDDFSDLDGLDDFGVETPAKKEVVGDKTPVEVAKKEAASDDFGLGDDFDDFGFGEDDLNF